MPMDPKLYQMLLETFKGELLEQHQLMVDTLISLETLDDKKTIKDGLDTLFRISHNLKGSAKSVAMDELASIAHQLEDIFNLWRDDNKKPEKSAIDTCLKLADEMIQMFESSQKSRSNSDQDEMIKVPTRRVARVNAKIDELIMFQLLLSNWVKKTQSVLTHVSQLNVEGCDALTLVKKQAQEVLQDSDNFTGPFARDLFVLQQEGRMMQLVAIEHLVLPLKRTVREIAEHEGKEVDLIIEGEAVEIDKSILEALKAPLQHLIRNAVAHGVEDVASRKKHNKPLPAKLLIHVSSSAGEIKLTLSDDGQGIDVTKLKQRALEKQLYTNEKLENMSDEEALNLVFHAGLSTADQVSELSGRGVGLDAVWNDIQRVRGTIEINSTRGEGCRFTLTLPLALASARGLFVRSQSSIFMLPTVSIHALHEVRHDALKRIDNQWTVVINKTPIAVYSLSELLGLGVQQLERAKRYEGILLGHHHTRIMILVDEVIEEHDVVVKPLPFPLNQLNYLSGVTLIERGELVFVLDVDHLIKKSTSALDSTHVLTESPEVIPKASAAVTRVLIVDDALTTRTLAVNALRAAGYETMTAEDGAKAWELLQDHPVDCVVTDIEMPRMDGFELTQAIKTDEKLKHLPVIIVSSRETKADKQRGLEVGASAYLVKKEFDTRTLINLVADLL
jgi:two-component system chemotaxis sensor kinase CheA